MSEPDILAMSEPRRLAEWSVRLSGHVPQTKPPAGTVGHRVDHYARFLKERWIYPLIHTTKDAGGFEVPFEAYVDDAGQVMFAEGSKPPKFPIPQRLDPREGGIVDTHIHFPMTDDRGRALSIRLLCVPFRLPSAAIGLLNRPSMVKGVIDTIAPLWTWTNGDDPDSPVHSSDGYSLKVEPLWKPLPGTKEPVPVWVGSDPFAISERQSTCSFGSGGSSPKSTSLPTPLGRRNSPR